MIVYGAATLIFQFTASMDNSEEIFGELQTFRMNKVTQNLCESLKPRSPTLTGNILFHIVKYESPYSADLTFISSAHKRQSSEQFQGTADKRQRTDSGSTPVDSVELSALLEQSKTWTPQQYLSLNTEHHKDSQTNHELQSENTAEHCNNGMLSDPQLYMRILSLPILESLVSIKPLG